jgi:flagellar hook-basal body complex protein FliE
MADIPVNGVEGVGPRPLQPVRPAGEQAAPQSSPATSFKDVMREVQSAADQASEVTQRVDAGQIRHLDDVDRAMQQLRASQQAIQSVAKPLMSQLRAYGIDTGASENG